jgi:hypothetical protein
MPPAKPPAANMPTKPYIRVRIQDQAIAHWKTHGEPWGCL